MNINTCYWLTDRRHPISWTSTCIIMIERHKALYFMNINTSYWLTDIRHSISWTSTRVTVIGRHQALFSLKANTCFYDTQTYTNVPLLSFYFLVNEALVAQEISGMVHEPEMKYKHYRDSSPFLSVELTLVLRCVFRNRMQWHNDIEGIPCCEWSIMFLPSLHGEKEIFSRAM